MSVLSDVIQSTVAVIKGMRRTLSEIPREKWTVQYPDEPVTVQPRYRGQHLLHVDEAGKEKCVACYLCAAACPSDCIYIEAEDDPRPYAERIGRDERYAKVYNIDYGRCIFCGFCVEACPKDAITHGYNFELSVFNRADLLKTKNDLLITKQKQSKNYRVALSTRNTKRSRVELAETRPLGSVPSAIILARSHRLAFLPVPPTAYC
jgi:NADH-quinone oxidoreductase subunit I